MPLACMTYYQCVMLCDLTTCYSIASAWFQRLELKYDKPVSNFAFNFNLRRYTVDDARGARGVDAQRPGAAVLVDPMKPMLKAPGTDRFKL